MEQNQRLEAVTPAAIRKGCVGGEGDLGVRETGGHGDSHPVNPHTG